MEDFKKNGKISLGFKSISKNEIIDFAKKYDPQYFHTNEEKAKESQFNGLIASGWQTCCIVMKLMCDSYLLETDSMGSPGLENVKWFGRTLVLTVVIKYVYTLQNGFNNA